MISPSRKKPLTIVPNTQAATPAKQLLGALARWTSVGGVLGIVLVCSTGSMAEPPRSSTTPQASPAIRAVSQAEAANAQPNTAKADRLGWTRPQTLRDSSTHLPWSQPQSVRIADMHRAEPSFLTEPIDAQRAVEKAVHVGNVGGVQKVNYDEIIELAPPRVDARPTGFHQPLKVAQQPDAEVASPNDDLEQVFGDTLGDLDSMNDAIDELLLDEEPAPTLDAIPANEDDAFELPALDAVPPADAPPPAREELPSELSEPLPRTIETPDTERNVPSRTNTPSNDRLFGLPEEDESFDDGAPPEQPRRNLSPDDVLMYNGRDCASEREVFLEAWRELRDNPISAISLDITPSVEPRETVEKAEASRQDNMSRAPSRVWRDREGAVMTEGRMRDFKDGFVIVDSVDGQTERLQWYELGNDELCFVSSWWELPSEYSPASNDYQARNWTMMTYTWTASALCHKPLYFEEVQLERYGHMAGPVQQVALSGAHFFGSILVLPYNMGVTPPTECKYSLGYYRPGSCAPWLLPAIPLSARGARLQTAALLGGLTLFP